MANRIKFTEKKKKIFLEILRKTANVTKAAAAIDILPLNCRRNRKKDKAFDKAWDLALEAGLDDLEEEARRRALEGVGEPVFYKGVEVATVPKYSDQLLMFLLNAHRPETYKYKWHGSLDNNLSGEIKVEIVKFAEKNKAPK